MLVEVQHRPSPRARPCKPQFPYLTRHALAHEQLSPNTSAPPPLLPDSTATRACPPPPPPPPPRDPSSLTSLGTPCNRGSVSSAGAVFIGKTNMDQFAAGLVGTRTPYGTAPNAFDARYCL